ncbi:ski2-like helicase [Grimontia celer]|uniref:Ski2-like helicase n=1 Tax=Grimontia celer TaxID=1796497 RepID=A0A128EZC9_9GAMM|nr:DEAD/DEAH box helicase [Grimontia celer]CZF79401.1 ski2-like helicase [Grimontia celer]
MLDLIKKIKQTNDFSFSETFSIYNNCSRMIMKDQNEGMKVLIYILEQRRKFDHSLDEMLADIVESVGFYPYLIKEKLTLSSTNSKVRLISNTSIKIPGKVFHDEQMYLSRLLSTDKNLVVSAPTSFGKSLLIEDIIASFEYRNIVIIQPTLALLDETRRKLKRYQDNYKLILRTSQNPDQDKGNIFLFTAERVNEYSMFESVDFLIIDEFYKLSSRRDDERSDTLNNAFSYLLKRFNPKFYLLGPNIEGISEGFEEKYNAKFFKTDYSLVACEEHNIYENYKNKFGERGEKKAIKERVLFDLLLKKRNENTLIYCSSPYRARYLSKAYLEYLIEKGVTHSDVNIDIIEWIERYVSKDWSLIKLLRMGIAIHDGALQKHITSTIIDYFNNGTIKQLFCTATIIEGVNTSAKNVIFFDKKKGANTFVDHFDYSNIRGRAGRMMEHYVGKVYNFNPVPTYDEIIVDIPFHEQNPISNEVLINIEEDEVIDKNSEQYQYIKSLPKNERELFSNNSLYIKGQKDLLEKIRSEVHSHHELLCWDSTPTYDQLSYCLGLAWDFLTKPDTVYRPMTKSRLVKITFDYGWNKNINELVRNTYSYILENQNKNKSDAVDDAIRDSFQILRHWFQYKIPKWLIVVNEIQKFVCLEEGKRPGNYLYYASSIENDFIQENLAILSEFGVPRSAIDKIKDKIPVNLNQDEVIKEIRTKKLFLMEDLLDYERKKLSENL